MKRIIALFLLIFLLLASCGEEASRQTVPFAPVSFRVDPTAYDNELNSALSYKIFTEENRRLPTDRFGYAGVLVVTDAKGGLHAFDLCCPHEDNRQIKVVPDYEGNKYNGKVKCPACGSVFVTSYGLGNVESGPSAEPLQLYHIVLLSDGSYRVFN